MKNKSKNEIKDKFNLSDPDVYVEPINDALIAEYSVLRGEISLYHSHQKQIMNFVFIIFAALIGFLGSDQLASDSTIISGLDILLAAPFLFLLLSLLYADRTVRIIRIADYIHNHLRIQTSSNLKIKVWDWENYKSNTSIFNRNLTLILDKIRWLVFIFPSLMSIIFYIKVSSNPFDDGCIKTVIFSLSCLSIILSLLVMFITEETRGIKTKNFADVK